MTYSVEKFQVIHGAEKRKFFVAVSPSALQNNVQPVGPGTIKARIVKTT